MGDYILVNGTNNGVVTISASTDTSPDYVTYKFINMPVDLESEKRAMLELRRKIVEAKCRRNPLYILDES